MTWVKELQARKEHQCDTCHTKIEPGNIYCSHRWYGEGTVHGIAICCDCQRLHSFINGGRLWVSHDHVRGLSDAYGPVDWLRSSVVAQLRVNLEHCTEPAGDQEVTMWMFRVIDAEVRMTKSELARLGQLLVDGDNVSIAAIASRISELSEYLYARYQTRALLDFNAGLAARDQIICGGEF